MKIVAIKACRWEIDRFDSARCLEIPGHMRVLVERDNWNAMMRNAMMSSLDDPSEFTIDFVDFLIVRGAREIPRENVWLFKKPALSDANERGLSEANIVIYR